MSAGLKSKGIIIAAVLGLGAVIIVPSMFSVAQTMPPTLKSLTGFAWNNNIGWISFSSANCDADKNGKSDGGLNCPASGTTIAPYGVSVNADGKFSGYAWSSRVGWISFNGSELAGCPIGVCEAKINNFSTSFDTTKSLSGWAKVLSDSSWIRLSGSNYGARFHSNGGISDYVWSEKYGWISFDGEKYHVVVGGIYNPIPLTITGVGFKQGAVVSLISGSTEIQCNAFNVSNEGKTLAGSCPSQRATYGNWDVKVRNPDGKSTTLSLSSGTQALFKVVPPTTANLVITTPSTSVANTGKISITKITGGSLDGASISLINAAGTKIFCFNIYEYDETYGWIKGKNTDGSILPMECDITDVSGGKWNFLVTKTTDSSGEWSDLSNNYITVDCIPKCTNSDGSKRVCGDNNCGGVCGPVTKSCSDGYYGNGTSCPKTGTQTCNELSGQYNITCSITNSDPRIGTCDGKVCGSTLCGSFCSNGKIISDNTNSQQCSVSFGTCSVEGTKTCNSTGSGYGSCKDGGVAVVDPGIAVCQNAACGASDGCGRFCDKNKLPVSTNPKTEGCAGKQCGNALNGCGETITCGTCSTANGMVNNACNSSNQCVCTPKTKTAACGAQVCGSASDGCGGTINCGAMSGACPSGQTCNISGQCACKPINQTVACNNICGTISNGCEGVYSCDDDDACSWSDYCNNGKCTFLGL